MVSRSSAASGIALEICVESPAGAAAAIAGGCDRIELCSALALGGLTPSAGLVAQVLAITRPARVPVRAMVRPRTGQFDYQVDDLALAVAEARALIDAGVQGLVFGATEGARLDVEALRAWVAALRPDRPPLTLHRAIDVVADPVAAVDEAVALGFDHVLTSGGAVSAPEGVETIAAMVAGAAGRCTIMAGAGIVPRNVASLVARTGVGAVHGSASDPAPAGVDRWGFGPMPRQTSAATVAALRRAIDDQSNLGQM